LRPKFLADADLNDRIIEGLLLREPSIDFLSATEGGTRRIPDPEVLRIAAETDRILVSHDRNTMIAHFSRFTRSQESPGLIIVRQRLPVGDAIEGLLTVWWASEAEEWMNVWRLLRR
jgi:predicted nuclease of predicted toxin-antitoxin system